MGFGQQVRIPHRRTVVAGTAFKQSLEPLSPASAFQEQEEVPEGADPAPPKIERRLNEETAYTVKFLGLLE